MQGVTADSGLSIFFELATKTVVDMLRFINHQPQNITPLGTIPAASGGVAKRKRGRRTFMQRILRTARRYAVEYVRNPVTSNIMTLVKVCSNLDLVENFNVLISRQFLFRRPPTSRRQHLLKSFRNWSSSLTDSATRSRG